MIKVYRLAYQNQSSAYVPAVLSDMKRGFQPIRATKNSITCLTHVKYPQLWKCFACPQNVDLTISIWLYSTNIISICLYILKTKSILAFMYRNNSLTLGLYRWSLPQVFTAFGSVLIAHEHAQSRSLTWGKDRATNCYSLNITLSRWCTHQINASRIFIWNHTQLLS